MSIPIQIRSSNWVESVEPLAARSPDPSLAIRHYRILRRLPGLTAGIGVCIGLLVLIGWGTDAVLLKSVLQGLVPMNPTTALCFMLTGSSIWLQRSRYARPSQKLAGRCLAGTVLVVSLIKLQSGGWTWDGPGNVAAVDTIMFRSRVLRDYAPMSLMTCGLFVLLSAAMLLLDMQFRRPPPSRSRFSEADRPADHAYWPAQWLTLAAGFGSLLAVTGYAYNLGSTAGLGAFRVMAIHTACTFVLLSAGALSLRPDRGLMSIATSLSPDGRTARRVLAAAVMMPLVIGWLATHGIRIGLFSEQFGIALIVAVSALTFTVVVWWNLSALHSLDLQRGQIEKGLRQAEAVYHSLVETLPQNIYRKNLVGQFTFTNRNFARALGKTSDEILGGTDLNLFPEELARRYRRDDGNVIATGQTLDLIEEHITPTGDRRYVQVMKTPVYGPDGSIIGTQGIFWDVTDRKLAEQELERKNRQLEEAARSERAALEGLRVAHEELKAAQSHLVQSEKMVALGQMVAGVAHEINNPLSFVSNNVVVLQRDLNSLVDVLALYRAADQFLEQNDPVMFRQIQELIDRVDLQYTIPNLSDLINRSRDGLSRIRQIVMDLRDFARLDESDLHEVDLNSGIASTINIISGYAKKRRINLEIRSSPLPLLPCYPAKVNQVVMNLISNAIDASPEKGTVVIETGVVADGEGKPSAVRFSVIDQGSGINPTVRDRIFDPFFTTKPPGQGTGLGLSISYGIVQEHGGRITVESTVGNGSTFTVTLPLNHHPRG